MPYVTIERQKRYAMYGAVLGDIIGSVYEWNNIKTKDFPLFAEHSCFTDDSILTMAAADWVLNGGTPQEKLFLWANKYKNRTIFGHTAFSKGFMTWLESAEKQPYNAKTNGCLMRISPVPFLVPNLNQALQKACEFTNATHNHPESLNAVSAYTEIIHALLYNAGNDDIINIGQKYGYDFCSDVETERTKMDKFYFSCNKTFAPAVVCFLEASSYEDAVRNAVSLGGDSDTLAAMTGAMAEARFSIPNNIARAGLKYLNPKMRDILKREYLEHQNTFSDCKKNIKNKAIFLNMTSFNFKM